jgi:hypothetical protein
MFSFLKGKLTNSAQDGDCLDKAVEVRFSNIYLYEKSVNKCSSFRKKLISCHVTYRRSLKRQSTVNCYGFQALDLNIEQEVTELQETIYDHIRSVRLTFTIGFVCIAYFSWWVRVLS